MKVYLFTILIVEQSLALPRFPNYERMVLIKLLEIKMPMTTIYIRGCRVHTADARTLFLRQKRGRGITYIRHWFKGGERELQREG